MIEPNDHLSRRLAPVLKRAGYVVAEVPDERQAVEMARTWGPDVVVIRVPTADTWLTQSTTLRQHLDAPAIVIGPYGDDGESRAVALDNGADDCLSEAFNPPELVARIRAILRRRCTSMGGEDCSHLTGLAIEARGVVPSGGDRRPETEDSRITSAVATASHRAAGRPAVSVVPWSGIAHRVAQTAGAVIVRFRGVKHTHQGVQ